MVDWRGGNETFHVKSRHNTAKKTGKEGQEIKPLGKNQKIREE